MRENWVICKVCDDEFNAEDPLHNRIGFYNQCYDCASEQGEEDTVKAVINYTDDGDFGGISLVSSEQFRRIQEIQNETASLSKSKK